MTFISYAQNYEDIMLFRALRDVVDGFYVDVGANSPDEHSVTKAFYERGWHGINIEPVMEFHQQLLTARPRDINLPIAISDTTGFVDFHDVVGTGLSTISPKIAEDHRAAGYEVVKRRVVVETLDEVFRKYVSGDVHFLKIDVEGLEDAVLRGVSLVDVRPWVIVVEATAVLSEVQTHASWENLLTGRGYSFVYFDGLNRFYVAEEHPELVRSFQSPPNVFDDWMRVGDRRAHDKANVLSAKLQEEQEAHKAQLDAYKARLDAQLEAHKAQLNACKAQLDAQVEAHKAQLEADTARQLDAYKAQLDAVRAEVEEWKARAEAAQVSTEEHRAHRAELEARLSELMRVMRRSAGLRTVIKSMREEFHDWVGIREQTAEREAHLAAQVAAATAEATALRQRIAELEYASAVTKLNLDAMLASSSWRVTAPIRAVKTAVVSSTRAVSAVVGGQQPGGSLIRRAVHWSARQPMIKRAAVAVLVRSPALERRVRAIVAPPPGVQTAAVAHIPQPRQLENSGPAIVSRNPSPAEAIVETAFQRALARAR
jgi:FkbM family methyltransferase